MAPIINNKTVIGDNVVGVCADEIEGRVYVDFCRIKDKLVSALGFYGDIFSRLKEYNGKYSTLDAKKRSENTTLGKKLLELLDDLNWLQTTKLSIFELEIEFNAKYSTQMGKFVKDAESVQSLQNISANDKQLVQTLISVVSEIKQASAFLYSSKDKQCKQ